MSRSDSVSIPTAPLHRTPSIVRGATGWGAGWDEQVRAKMTTANAATSVRAN
jgi:hypothetical protein